MIEWPPIRNMWSKIKSMIRMSFFCFFIAMAITVAGGTPVYPADKDVPIPDIIPSGLRDYGFNGAEAAIKTWLKGSVLEGSPDATDYITYLHQIESKYGKYVSFDTVRSHPLTSAVSVFDLILNYERGPVFARFMTFQNKKAAKEEWIISQISFQTTPDWLMPPHGHPFDSSGTGKYRK